MITAFELFVAGRYLRARRKEKVISVITVISVIGVAAGVMALIISLAVNNGFQNTLQRNMLAATAHVNILDKDPGRGIEDWPSLIQQFRKVPHVVAVAPVLYDEVLVTGPRGTKQVTLKGIDPRGELSTSETLRHLKSGSLARLQNDEGLPGIVVGSKLAQDAGLAVEQHREPDRSRRQSDTIRPRPAQPALSCNRHFRNQLLRRRRPLGLRLPQFRAEAAFRG